jgi:hypothetical protein
MPKILVIIAGKDQAVAAISHLVETRPSDISATCDHIVILNVHPPKQPWQQSNTPKRLLEMALERESSFIRNATAPWLDEAGIACETRDCFGDVANTVSRVVEDEGCDEILITEPETGRFARLVEWITGKRPTSYLDRIIPDSPVPVIVVKKDTVERYQGRDTADANDPKTGARKRRPAPSLSA